jgi:cobalt/nickel transport system ATP-binding protein
VSALIEAHGIAFAYPGYPHVLNGVDLSLGAGERLCLTGPNGAGKSTLLLILMGLLKPQGGRVIAFGRERREERDFDDVRRLAGFVFQDPDDQLFCPTVAEDIAFGPLNMGKSKGEAAEIVEGVLARLALGHLRDRITHKLSGGEKRLVTLAAVLAMEPQVLLLDEPTNGLDEPTCERVTDILNGLPQAMIIVSHDPHFRRTVETRSVRLVAGKLVEEAGPQWKDAAIQR